MIPVMLENQQDSWARKESLLNAVTLGIVDSGVVVVQKSLKYQLIFKKTLIL